MEFVAGFFAPWIVYVLILALHLALPARKVIGYVRDDSGRGLLRYRINGLLVLGVLVALWAVLGSTNVLPWDWLYEHRWPGAAGAVVLGVLFSLAMVLPAPRTGRSLAADLYFGRSLNRQVLGARVDVKMFLYLAGAVMLALNLLSFTAHHVIVFGAAASAGVLLYCALFLWFVIDYLVFEHVHLYTYDIFAERVGFKLGFGCLAFYPYFYPVGLWVAADLPSPGTPTWLLVVFAAVFFAGWILARGANMQKYLFKRHAERAFLGILQPRVVGDADHVLLCSGFWGVARHINYLGEILMATGLTLVLGYPGRLLVWLYPLYYVGLLFSRERADDRRCAQKYGDLWQEYARRVPRRIIPWVY